MADTNDEASLTVEEIQRHVHKVILTSYYVVMRFDFFDQWDQVKKIAEQQGWVSAAGIGFYMPDGWEPPKKE